MTFVLLSSCAEPDGPIGSSVGHNIGGVLDSAICWANAEVSFSAEPIGTGGSPHLYVGGAGGVTSKALIRFLRPERPFEWQVDSARFELSYQGSIGEGDYPEIGTAFFDYLWDESDPPDFDEIPPQLVRYPIDEIQPDSGRLSHDIRADIITDWLNWQYGGGESDTVWSDTARADSGLTVLVTAMRSVGGGDLTRLIRFRARTALEDSTTGELKPRLRIFITASDSGEGAPYQDTLLVLPSDDVFLVNDINDFPTGLTIGSGALYRTFIRFDITSITDQLTFADVVINRAMLILYRDRTGVAPIWPPTPSVWPKRLGDDEWLGDPRAAIPTILVNTPTAIDSAAESVTVVLTGLVSEWIEDAASNHGVALVSGGEGLDVDRIAFHPSAADVALRPRLKVYYTRFDR